MIRVVFPDGSHLDIEEEDARRLALLGILVQIDRYPNDDLWVLADDYEILDVFDALGIEMEA